MSDTVHDREQGNALVISRFARGTTKKDVEELMSQYGPTSAITVRETLAFVDFVNADDAKVAKESCHYHPGLGSDSLIVDFKKDKDSNPKPRRPRSDGPPPRRDSYQEGRGRDRSRSRERPPYDAPRHEYRDSRPSYRYDSGPSYPPMSMRDDRPRMYDRGMGRNGPPPSYDDRNYDRGMIRRDSRDRSRESPRRLERGPPPPNPNYPPQSRQFNDRQWEQPPPPPPPSSKRTIIDSTADFADSLRPFDKSILGSHSAIIGALSSPLVRRIDVLSTSYSASLCSDSKVFRHCGLTECGRLLPFIVSYFMKIDPLTDSDHSEQNVFDCMVQITGQLWSQMKAESRCDVRCAYNKTEVTKSTQITATVLRPDECVYFNEFLVFKGEHKSDDKELRVAEAELSDKMPRYSLREYGPVISYLPCYAAAGRLVKFCLIDVRTAEIIEVARYNLITNSAAVLLMSLNMFRLALTMLPFIPASADGGRKPYFRFDTGMEYGTDYAIKQRRHELDTCPLELYQKLDGIQIPCAVQVLKVTSSKLKIAPVGYSLQQYGNRLSYSQVKSAVRCTLRCLAALHQAGYVHRDIRWDNLIQLDDINDFRVIDFELASVAGARLSQKISYFHSWLFWPSDAAVSNVARAATGVTATTGTGDYSYQRHHDLKLVANMIAVWARHHRHSYLLSKSDSGFIRLLQDDSSTAEELLGHEWLRSQQEL